MKEPDYVMLMMATYGNLEEVAEGTAKRTHQQGGRETTTNFRYTTPFYNHFKYRHQVDDHNAKRHAPISVEDCLGARRWDVRQFSFLLALTEVNVKLAMDFGKPKKDIISMLAFRKRLAKALIFNHWLIQEIKEKEVQQEVSPNGRKRRKIDQHEHIQRPIFTGKYNGATRKFNKTTKKYVRLKCSSCPSDCKSFTRWYCRCDPSLPLCKVCYGQHILGAKPAV
jgi:hypothetical protein